MNWRSITRGLTYAPLAALVVSACACTPAEKKSEPPPHRPNIFLITIDTLRPDHLSGYGYRRATSPFLDSLMAHSTVFYDAWAPSSWTPPSMASLMTGVYPARHGVQEGIVQWRPTGQGSGGKRKKKATIVDRDVLAPRFVTLAEHLRAAGYATFGVSSNAHLSRELGFAQGFQYFDDHLGFAEGKDILPIVRQWRTTMLQSQPFFLWVHLFEPHWPYFPHSGGPDFGAPAGCATDLVRAFPSTLGPTVAKHMKLTPDSDVFRCMMALYDGEILHADGFVETLLRLGDWTARTDVVVITSDHGEEFLEHGALGHGHQLTPETLRIPLIIALPAGQSDRRRVSVPVSLLDVYPTLLAVVGAPPPENLDGVNLSPLLTGGEAPPPRPLLGELARDLQLRSAYSPPHFYLYNGMTRREGLFRLDRDPDARHNIAAIESAALPPLREAVRTHIHRRAAPPPQVRQRLDPEETDALKALGYLQ